MRLGHSVPEFLDLTPREFGMAMKAAEWRMDRQRREAAWIAWHTAALMRSRKLPTLSRFLGKDTGSQPAKSREQLQSEHDEMVRRHDELMRRTSARSD